MVFVARITPALFTRTVKRTKAIACRGDTGLPIGFDGHIVAKIDGILERCCTCRTGRFVQVGNDKVRSLFA